MVPPPAFKLVDAGAVSALADQDRSIEHGVDLLLQALQATKGDRIILETDATPMLIIGPRKCPLMRRRLPLDAIQRIAACLFPPEYLEALEDVGGTRYRWPGFTATADYAGSAALTIAILRTRF